MSNQVRGGQGLPPWAGWLKKNIKGLAAVVVALTVLAGALIGFWPLAHELCENVGLCANDACDPDDILCGLKEGKK